MAITIGIIAEDKSDVEVLRILLQKLTPRSLRVRSHVGKGGGKIISKTNKWANSLRTQGCTRLIIVHDLDDHDEDGLRAKIQEKISGCRISFREIIIPVREIEAWLIADSEAIAKAMRLKNAVRKFSNPESLSDPKKEIRNLVQRASKNESREYVHNIDNPKIAEFCRIPELTKCRSFRILRDFAEMRL